MLPRQFVAFRLQHGPRAQLEPAQHPRADRFRRSAQHQPVLLQPNRPRRAHYPANPHVPAFQRKDRAIVQPGGSVRDQEVIDAVRAAGIAMYFTGTRHFFH